MCTWVYWKINGVVYKYTRSKQQTEHKIEKVAINFCTFGYIHINVPDISKIYGLGYYFQN